MEKETNWFGKSNWFLFDHNYNSNYTTPRWVLYDDGGGVMVVGMALGGGERPPQGLFAITMGS